MRTAPQITGLADAQWTIAASAGPCTKDPAVSVVVPIHNEAGNIAPLLDEIESVLAKGRSFEVIYVDDGSTDGSSTELELCATGRPWLRCLRHPRSYGQSAAVRSGVIAARAPIIVTLDGDGQNDPAFIPALVDALIARGPACGLVQGQRLGRKDTRSKRFQSKIANTVRGAILRDGARDTGCGLKCFSRAVYLDLPYFNALHRFMSALVKRDGHEVAFVDVVDRPRVVGASHYGLLNRALLGAIDLIGVRWLIRGRRRVPIVSEAPVRRQDDSDPRRSRCAANEDLARRPEIAFASGEFAPAKKSGQPH